MGENEDTGQPPESTPAEPIETPEKAEITDGPPDSVPFERLQTVSRERNELRATNAELLQSQQLLDQILGGDAATLAALQRQGIAIGSQPSTARATPTEEDPFAENPGMTPEQVQQMIQQGLQQVQVPLRQMAADQARATLASEFGDQYDSTRDDPRLREILTAAPGLSAKDAFVLLQSRRSVPAEVAPPPTDRGTVQSPRSGGRHKPSSEGVKANRKILNEYLEGGSKNDRALEEFLFRSHEGDN